jgi:signal transduction histidine kinase
VIQTDLDVALLAGGHSPSVEAALRSAHDEAHRLARTAEDMLVLARAAGGQLQLDTRSVTVPDVLDWARERFSPLAADEGRTIVVTSTSAPLLVDADEDRLRQVLANLVDNALRHGSGDITLAAYAVGRGVTIEVRDEGSGFSAAFAPRAFDRLARADPAQRLGGAGLGLAIVDAIVTAHGGTATVAIGRPATVRVWIPTNRDR